jgi:hypothetical protein
VLYAATTLSFFVTFFTGDRKVVTDAVGTAWNTGDIYETQVLLTVYGMFFLALLALLRIAQRRTREPTLTTAPSIAEHRTPSPAHLSE